MSPLGEAGRINAGESTVSSGYPRSGRTSMANESTSTPSTYRTAPSSIISPFSDQSGGFSIDSDKRPEVGPFSSFERIRLGTFGGRCLRNADSGSSIILISYLLDSPVSKRSRRMRFLGVMNLSSARLDRSSPYRLRSIVRSRCKNRAIGRHDTASPWKMISAVRSRIGSDTSGGDDEDAIFHGARTNRQGTCVADNQIGRMGDDLSARSFSIPQADVPESGNASRNRCAFRSWLRRL